MGRRTETQAPATGDVTQYSYTGSYPDGVHPTGITDPTGQRSYEWNASSGTLSTYTDVNGHNTAYLYDSWLRLNWITNPAGGATGFNYTPSTLEITREQTSALNEETLDTFDGLGRLAVAATETSVGNWSRVDTCYNGGGEKSFVSYPYASSSSAGPANCSGTGQNFQYDALGRPTQTAGSDGSTFLTSYSGHALQTQDEGNGNGATRVTRIAQTDGLGRLASVCEVTSVNDAAGYAPTSCGLDIAGTGFLTTYTHDVLDDLTGVAQNGASGDVVRNFTYDPIGRLTHSNNPETGAIVYTYGSDPSCAAPNDFPTDLVSRLDARGNRTCYQYNAAHQVMEKAYSGPDATPTAYYAYGQTSALGIGGLTNTIGRLSSEYTSASAGQVFSYDPDGREVANGQITPGVWGTSSFNYTYGYGLAGDITSAALPAGATLTQTFDLAGRPLSLSSSVNGALISSLIYNARGQELSAALGNGNTETRGYDPRGRLTSLTEVTAQHYTPGTPGTGSITISGVERMGGGPPGCHQRSCSVWDTGDVWGTINTVQEFANFGQGSTSGSLASALATSLNQNSYITAAANGSVISIAATSAGSATNYPLSAGADTQFGSFSATASGANLTGGTDGYYTGGTTIYSLSGMSYAPDGDLLAAADTANGTFSYAYNDLNQLTSAACSASPCAGDSASYAYDGYGNRWTETGTLPAAAPPFLSFTGNNNRVDGWSYDANGNLLGYNGHTYQYDAENRLISVDGGPTASYVYDAEGRRVHESVGGVVKEFIYGEGGQQLTVVGSSGNLEQAETYVGGRYLGTGEPSAFVWALSDELGTVRVRTNSSGAAVETDTSWPFGAYLNQVGTNSNLHFTGKYRDGETGFDYFGARYYASQLGRFMTADWSEDPEPIPYADLSNPQSLNLYSYVLNNPVTVTDPDGHAAGEVAGGYGPMPNGWCNAFNPCGDPLDGSADTVAAEADYVGNVLGPAQALIDAQNAARKQYGPNKATGQTFCNQATCAVASAVGAPMGPLQDADGAPYSANEMATNLAGSSEYRVVGPAEAQLLADERRLVIGAWANPDGHGHVVTVRPDGVPGEGGRGERAITERHRTSRPGPKAESRLQDLDAGDLLHAKRRGRPMRRLLPLLLGLLLVPACGQKVAFTPPDGGWWLAANATERDGFLTGYFECHSFSLRKAVLVGPDDRKLGDEITEFFRQRPADAAMPVSEAISRVYNEWQRTGAYHFVHAKPENEYTGLWLHYEQIDPIVRGFVACQQAEGHRSINIPISVLAQRVAKWYGKTPSPDGDLNGSDKTENDKLGSVILRAEKEAPRR